MQHVQRDRTRQKRKAEMKRKLPEYTNEQVEKLIANLIHSERDRKILRRRLIDGITYEKLAEEFDLSTV